MIFRSQDMLRTKDILNLKEFDRPLVIHGVKHIFLPSYSTNGQAMTGERGLSSLRKISTRRSCTTGLAGLPKAFRASRCTGLPILGGTKIIPRSQRDQCFP